MENIYQKIINKCLKEKISTEKELLDIKRWASKTFNIPTPSNVSLLQFYHNLLEKGRIKRNEKLEKILRKRKIRSLSGVVVVSVLTKPYPCPGRCIYCPLEKGIPKSYLSGEPAVERAKKLNFSPFLQVKKRIESLKKQGHPVDKIELRIIGGTWSFYSQKYRIWFISNCFAAANDRERKNYSSIKFLEKEQKKNEKAQHRIVGISIETRPDLIDEKEILNLRRLGVTMVELGVQTVFDDILKKCQRGHLVKETIRATKLLKDAGFKVMYQMMPNLPGSNLKRDLECFEILFNDSRFKPDWLKIYPCLVCKGSELYQIWKKGNYKPYSCKQLISLLIKIKSKLPYWTRVARIFRDIPVSKIEGGCKISNLREIVQKELKKRKLKCKCIRCREVRERYDPKEKVYLFREDYEASDGKEIFLSFENKKREKLLAFLRVRIPSFVLEHKSSPLFHFLPVLKNAGLIREIHTYGQMLPLKERSLSPQHRGLGKKLVKEAEKIIKKEFHLSKVVVISGVGVREYWRKLGYRLYNTYMVKKI